MPTRDACDWTAYMANALWCGGAEMIARLADTFCALGEPSTPLRPLPFVSHTTPQTHNSLLLIMPSQSHRSRRHSRGDDLQYHNFRMEDGHLVSHDDPTIGMSRTARVRRNGHQDRSSRNDVVSSRRQLPHHLRRGDPRGVVDTSWPTSANAGPYSSRGPAVLRGVMAPVAPPHARSRPITRTASYWDVTKADEKIPDTPMGVEVHELPQLAEADRSYAAISKMQFLLAMSQPLRRGAVPPRHRVPIHIADDSEPVQYNKLLSHIRPERRRFTASEWRERHAQVRSQQRHVRFDSPAAQIIPSPSGSSALEPLEDVQVQLSEDAPSTPLVKKDKGKKRARDDDDDDDCATFEDDRRQRSRPRMHAPNECVRVAKAGPLTFTLTVTAPDGALR